MVAALISPTFDAEARTNCARLANFIVCTAAACGEWPIAEKNSVAAARVLRQECADAYYTPQELVDGILFRANLANFSELCSLAGTLLCCALHTHTLCVRCLQTMCDACTPLNTRRVAVNATICIAPALLGDCSPPRVTVAADIPCAHLEHVLPAALTRECLRETDGLPRPIVLKSSGLLSNSDLYFAVRPMAAGPHARARMRPSRLQSVREISSPQSSPHTPLQFSSSDSDVANVY